MTLKVVEEISERLKAGLFIDRDLRRWFREIERCARTIIGDAAMQELCFRCHDTRVCIMYAMSRTLTPHPVRLDRIAPFCTDMSCAKVKEYRKHPGDPVVLIGLPGGGRCALCDGRHRVTAARQEGRETIMAVFAEEREPRPDEQWH